MWAEENNCPIYWWYKRPVSSKWCSEDADDVAESMHQRCSGSKEYYIQGCNSTLKHMAMLMAQKDVWLELFIKKGTYYLKVLRGK